MMQLEHPMENSSPSYRIFENPHSASAQVASEIASIIRARAVQGRNVVLGLTSGRSTIPVYQDLIYQHREEGLSFKNVITFNLAEFHGLPSDHPASCHSFVKREFLDHVDVPANQSNRLSGEISDSEMARYCREYEAMIVSAGGIDYQIVGIARNGRVGFNEPGSSIESRTRMVKLGAATRGDITPNFEGHSDKVPKHAITVGCGTMLEARKTALLAWGPSKARIIRKALMEPVSQKNCASYFQSHPASRFYIDQSAAASIKDN